MAYRVFRGLILAILTLVLARSYGVYAQQTGHYVQGITGLDNGTTAPPGVYVAYLPYIYDIDTLKGSKGNTILRPDLTLVVHNAVYQVTTKRKILGASYGIGVIFPIVNTRLTANFLNTNIQNAGVSDVVCDLWSRCGVQPVERRICCGASSIGSIRSGGIFGVV